MKLILSILFLALSSVAMANNTATGAAMKGDHPCMKIKQACEAAGFVKGEAKNKKGLYVNCMKPIMSGQSVAGVSVDAATVQACQTHKESHKEKHEAK